MIESEDPKKPVALQFSYAPDPDTPTQFWAGLMIEGGSVTFRHVHFMLEAGYTPPQLAAGVAVKAGQVVFDRCTFSQQTPDEELIAKRGFWPIASAAVWNTTLERPPVVFRHCWFANGQAALSVKGGAKVELDDCAFGPHSCLFHVWGQDKDDRADLFMTHISAQVVNGPVFRLDDNTSCTLGVQYSIFSCPTNGSLRDRPDLIRQTGTLRDVKFEGKRNGYHQLMSFWARPGTGKDEVEGADWPKFKTRIALAPAGGNDAGSSLLKANPWPKPGDDDVRTAFSIDPKMPELRQENEKKNRPIGVEAAVWAALYPTAGLPALEPAHPAETAVKLGPKERLVDPSGAETGARIHKKIEAAISEADPDDVIFIKHNGELKIDPTSLTDMRHVKLKPFAGCQPILVLGKSIEKAPALFNLHHSQIEFEQLEFLLRADVKHSGQSIVSVGGDKACKFEECVITLDNPDNPNVDLDVVSLLNPRDTTKGGSESKPRADVKFKGSFVRGRGNLVHFRSSLPLDLDVDSSLVCLAGSLLTIHSSADAVSADTRSTVRLHKTTSYLGEPALRLIAGKQGRGLVSTQVQATDCLFGVSGFKALVRVEGLENENQLKKLLSWTGSSNAFAGFEKLLEQSALDGGMALVYQADDWKRFTEAGPGTRFERTALQPTGGAERAFQLWLPTDFGQKPELSQFGASIDTLPRPTALLSGRDF